MIAVSPQSEDEFGDVQADKIVWDHSEYSIVDFETDQVKGGRFTAIGMKFLTEMRVEWRIMPENRKIMIVSSGSKGSDTECSFEYRS